MNADNEPISIDLAREADFSVGPLSVRPSLRQVETGGESETVEPRVMQVLVALARRRGAVVSKDELIQLCWGGRIVGEDAISRVIARLRKLGEQHAAFGLETIPRVGYRLTASGAGEAPKTVADPGARLGSGRRRMWIAVGVAVVAAVIAGAALLGGSDRDVDSVVARLTERLQQQNASPRDIRRSVDAAEALGASGRSEERSAFAALASGDSLQAIAVLEDLAAKLESRGEDEAAAEVLTRVGSLALVVDQGRGLAARRKAFELDPKSLAAFQGLFFDTAVLKGRADSLALAQDELKRTDLSPRMRGWILAHLAVIFADSEAPDLPAAEATLDEIEALHAKTSDPVLESTINWIGGLIAFNRDDLRFSRQHAEQAYEGWKDMPEPLSNGGEVALVRVLYAQGERHRAFTMGANALDRRGKTGEFLPTPIISLVCEAGMFIGEVERAEPFCQSLVRRSDPSLGAAAKAYAGLIAAAKGDASRAAAEFAAGRAIDAAGSAVPVRLMFFEGWAAMKAGDMPKGEELMTAVAKRLEESQDAERYRSFRAHVLWLLGEGFIAAGQLQKACAPLETARALYTEVGGDAGRAAVDALRVAAGCPPG